jgi:hypothetical protein
MSKSNPRDAAPLVLLAAAAAISLVASSAPRWGLSLLRLAGRPAAVSLAGALLIFACGLLLARLVVTRRTLDHRVAMLAIPADSFDPSPESVVRFASGLSRSRRALRGLLDAPASAASLAGMLGAYARRSKNRYEGYWPFERLYNPIDDQAELMMEDNVAEIVDRLESDS